MKKNFVTNFHCVSCPSISWGGTMSTMLSWSQVPCWHRIEIHNIRTDPPITTMDINFFLCGNLTVVFACKSIHFKGDLFRATELDHRLSEELVTDKSIENVFVVFLSTPLLKLCCRVEFFATWFLPVPVNVWPVLPYVEVWDGEQIQHGWDVLLATISVVLSFIKCPHVKYTMPALQYVRHALHSDFGSTSTISHSSVFQASIIAYFDSSLKGLNAQCCWRSLWSAFRSGWFSICWIKLWTLMPCERFTVASGIPEMLKSMFSSSIARLNLFTFEDAVSRCPGESNSCTAWFHRFLRSIVNIHDAIVFTLHRFPRSKNQVLLATVYQQSLVNRTCFLPPQVSPFDHQFD